MRKRNFRVIYVSGPYTGNVVRNVQAAVKAADLLVECGFIPICPHLTHLWDTISPHSYDYWMDMDLKLVEIVDAVFRLPGESHGADMECEKASKLGIPVYMDIQQMIDDLGIGD